MWQKPLSFARSPSYPELPLLRAFAGYKAATYLFWQAPDMYASSIMAGTVLNS
jgi:hypothetical protein